MANRKNITTTSPKPNPFEEDNVKLQKEIEELRKQIELMNQPQIISDEIEVEEYEEIRPNKYIKVISLNFGRLILSTDGSGRGKIYQFNKFGDVRNIVYSDLANIIHNQQSFAEQGRFFIADKKVVKNHGLVEYYDKFLTKDIIENLLTYNKDQIIALFKGTTDTQREIIVDLMIQKIKNKQDADIKIDVIDALSRVYGKNIYEQAIMYQE